MRLDGRRSSNNVDDRRGSSGSGRGMKLAGGGIAVSYTHLTLPTKLEV